MADDNVIRTERRRQPRRTFQEEVKFRMGPGSGLFSGVTWNLSGGGAFVRTYNPPKVESTVTLTVAVPRFLEATDVQGRVVWVRPEVRPADATGPQVYCFGVHFTNLSARVKAAIDAFVDEAFMLRTPSGLAPRAPRKEIHAPLKFHAGNEPGFYTGWAQNVSDGGILVQTTGQLPAQGAIVKVAFRVPYLDQLMELEAEVRWLRDDRASGHTELPGGAFGARFVNLPDEVRDALNRYMKSSETFFYPDEGERL